MNTNNSGGYHKDGGVKNQEVAHELPVKFLEVLEWVKSNYSQSIVRPS